jgi:alkanesulfonate monooxygenase SsuD/methylene tetrahydromethanopterin reductase-like flavin-dependent oxidoreductase (luciferase family)
MARTVDHISNGRAILGIGSGWFEQDYDEYGYEFGTAISRLHALEKSLERIVKRMKELNPQPIRKIPILIGGGGEKVTLRITAQYADIWHGFATKTEERSGIETVAHKNNVLNNWCKEIGRDPSEIKRSIGIDIKRIDLADELIEAGATEVTLAVNGPGYDLTDVKEWIAWRDSKN